MSISICTLCYGKKYSNFLLTWANNISKLETDPDEIIIVHDDNITFEQINYVTSLINPIWIKINNNLVWSYTPAIFFNLAIERAASEWIVRSDIDDILYPHALDDIKNCEEDIIVYNFDFSNNTSMEVDSNFDNIFIKNPFPSCSPFKKWIWEKKEIQDKPFEDWIFWAYAYINGAKVKKINKKNFMYVIGENSSNRSRTRKEIKLGRSEIKFIESKRYEKK